jgi:hypothetical protein
MEDISVVIGRLAAALALPRPRDERGDVPGWVLITVMTAGLVMGIWGVAEGQLQSMLTSALNQVK